MMDKLIIQSVLENVPDLVFIPNHLANDVRYWNPSRYARYESQLPDPWRDPDLFDLD